MMCICCNKILSLISGEYLNEEEIVFKKSVKQISGIDEAMHVDAGSYMWNGGIVGLLSGGFGSRHDGDEFIVAICDDCIHNKIQTGNIAYINNYIENIDEPILTKNKTIWRRYNRIGNILNDE